MGAGNLRASAHRRDRTRLSITSKRLPLWSLFTNGKEVNDDDVGQIKHIAISSAPSTPSACAVGVVAKGNVDTNRCVELCQVSDKQPSIIPDSKRIRKLLDVIDDGQGRNGVLKVYSLSKSLAWLSTYKSFPLKEHVCV